MAPPATTRPSVDEQLALLLRGTEELIEEGEMRARLERARAEGRPLRIKFGMDPSAPDLHLGHMVQLRKLRDLQECGHRIVLIVGDATAMVGDPSGRNKLRPQLDRAAVEANLETYVDQAGRVLDMQATEVRRNSEWFDRMDFQGFLALCSRMTVARMIERDTFQKRMEASEPIGIHEFVYPLMQGWDSVEVRADLEIGGTDQKFNLLVGRQLQGQEGQPPQCCLTLPLIDGPDGRKMSKSYGNAIGLTDAPRDMYGKVMSASDEVMQLWFRTLTRVPEGELMALLAGHPREAKARLAGEVTGFLHGAEAARDAAAAFDSQFVEKRLPDDIPEHDWRDEWTAEGVPLGVLLRELGLAKSSSEARRLVQQGGVRLAGDAVADASHVVRAPAEPLLIQVGKRRFATLLPPA